MYKHSRFEYAKHLDFIILDVLSLQVAYWVACAVYLHHLVPYDSAAGAILGIGLALVDLLVIISRDTMKNVMHRGYLKEAVAVLKQSFFIFSLFAIFIFLIKTGSLYSRITVLLTGGIYIVLSYIVRCLWKLRLKKQSHHHEERSILFVVKRDEAVEMIGRFKRHTEGFFHFAGVCIEDEKEAEGDVLGVPIVANVDTVSDYVCREWIDEIFVASDELGQYNHQLMEEFNQMGITVHLELFGNEYIEGQNVFVEKISGYTVITSAMKKASPSELFMKRFIDICAGIVGCLFTGLIVLVVGPIIKIQSPGPIFFKQDRIGKNGKRFKMYKIRSMYMDAEERKKELMKQNRVKDGLMFKLDEDPRIIGSKILEDGTYKKGIGNVIRDLSLDEFPQFINVLLGEMSLVGTRPPTVDEWEKYKYHHRSRLSIKPGITGMWQTSGRSNITDFEEVVRLDTEYIANWSIGLDIKLIFKTIVVALQRDGSM